MKSIEEIWSTRINHHINETRAYLKYMLNDHLLFVFIFLGAGGALTYSQWLEVLPPDFPAVLIMTLTFTFILLTSSVRTLLKEADIVFLLPMEHKLDSYFKKAFSYSMISQSFIVIVSMILFAPLYLKATNANGRVLLLSIVLLLVIKFWNLRISWKMGYFTESSSKWNDLIVRFAINVLAIFFLLSQQYIFVGIVFFIMFAYDLYFSKIISKKAIKWEQLIQKEDSKKQSFYKIANLFTDVPKLKKQAKRRKYLDWFVKQIAYRQENVYEYLFIRAFLRSGDYLGIFVRLTLIGSIIITFIENQLYGNAMIAIFFIFLTGIQIMSLYKHYELLELPNLYPKAEKRKLSSFLTIMFRMLLIQVCVYSLVTVFTANLITFAITLLSGIAFVAIFVFVYMNNRIKKKEKVGL
ncbi:ABC transporter permease [Metabacillus litoralis]|uniref:ABC transporter permease n=1 Tax=Metabacillus litoralis TaxID=152268 RepID=A0A5C6VYM1_9BACI|nr:ABC transporter permease [Metabacillus litoralis]TXC89708.1 ABC transporter permease [Metabacillus litoralis]